MRSPASDFGAVSRDPQRRRHHLPAPRPDLGGRPDRPGRSRRRVAADRGRRRRPGRRRRRARTARRRQHRPGRRDGRTHRRPPLRSRRVNDQLRAWLRTTVPAAWSALVTWLITAGAPQWVTEPLGAAGQTLAVPLALGAVYALLRAVEPHLPVWATRAPPRHRPTRPPDSTTPPSADRSWPAVRGRSLRFRRL